MAANWKFSVRKESRGMQGQWFASPAAATFVLEASAHDFAAEWQRELKEAGIGGHRIVVRARKRTPGYPRFYALN